MKIACLADVHANIHALEPVLEQLEGIDYDALICCGDLVGYGAFPNEVVEFLQVAGSKVIKGNVDEAVVSRGLYQYSLWDSERERAYQRILGWTARELTEENMDYLRNLPTSLEVNDENGVNILAVHGSPDSMTEGLYENTFEERFEQIAEEVDTNILVFGHTHIGFEKNVNGVKFVNCGSIGWPADGDTRACYALMEIEPAALMSHVTIRRVKYDVETAAKSIIRKGLPPELADLLRWGK